MEDFLTRRSKTGTKVGNMVQNNGADQSQGSRWEGVSVHGG